MYLLSHVRLGRGTCIATLIEGLKTERNTVTIVICYVDGPQSPLIVYETCYAYATHARDAIIRDPRTNGFLIELSNHIEQNIEQIMPQSCNAKPG